MPLQVALPNANIIHHDHPIRSNQKLLPSASKPLSRSSRRTKLGSTSNVMAQATGSTKSKAVVDAAQRRSHRSKEKSSPVKSKAPPVAKSAVPPTSETDVTVFRFPTILPRPSWLTPVTPESIAEHDPSLKGVPIQFLKDFCQAKSALFFQGISATNTKVVTIPENTPLQSQLEIPINHSVKFQMDNLPTHLLCVKGEATPQKGSLFPIHNIVLFTHCSRLPSFPQPTPPESKDASTVSLPIVQLQLFHPESFFIIYDYIYTKHFARLTSALLPTPPSGLSNDPKLSPEEQYNAVVDGLVEHYSIGALYEKLKYNHGVWRNVADLGITEEGLWRTMNMAWNILLKSLQKLLDKSKSASTATHPRPEAESTSPVAE